MEACCGQLDHRIWGKKAAHLLAVSMIADPNTITYCGRHACRRYNMFRISLGLNHTMGQPLLGITAGKSLLAVAALICPDAQPSPMALRLARLQFAVFVSPYAVIRSMVRRQQEHSTVSVPEPHHVLQLLSVHPQYQGRGLGKKLLTAIHQVVDDHAESQGTLLETSIPGNVSLYERFGYEVVNRTSNNRYDTFMMFRPST